ncbi:uncharacterized protein N7483_003677 [Penicillium malachiteum]|uniref:uncharacterized protein n=1 Tax=Penicillium malachiteum TaxID=1324776 RepID=UPI0025469FD8|nr:uncharacterized protein N7483_003677 [Penicillium malachiteum]KAJ5729169.1 hypothetical protein N7483_003677 [Penicillium malachiteum]
MSFLADMRLAGGSAVLQNLIPTILLVTTPKRSILRFLAIPCMIWIASQNVRQMNPFCQTYVFLLGPVFQCVPQALNLLLINPLDAADLTRENPTRTKTLIGRFWYAAELMLFPRGLRNPSTTWQYALFDLIQFSGHQQVAISSSNVIFTYPEWNLSLEKWIERIMTNGISWLVIGRICADSRYRLASIIFVGSGLYSPADWVPMYGRMAESYTLKNLWGTFWHQMVRQPLSAMSNWITRDILQLPKGSILESSMNIFVVFLQSGLLHLFIDIAAGIPAEYSGSLPFFTSFTVGIIIEQAVQNLYYWIKGPGAKEYAIWKRVVGYMWVLLWVGIPSTWWIHPNMQNTPPHKLSMVPFSFSDHIGSQTVTAFAAISGMIVFFGLGGEV